jgi:hypothetical protein
MGIFSQSERSQRGKCLDAHRSEFCLDLWPTKVMECMKSILLRFYQRARCLGARCGWWFAEIQVRYSQEVGTRDIFMQQGVNTRGFCVQRRLQNPWGGYC